VTPYNLWSVRALRWFEVFFFMITGLWWVLLFVSIFVSPPFFNSRGSGFFDVAYTTLTIGNILTALLFFAFPSTAMSILSMAISVLLLIDMIIILAVPQIRVEEGWIGIASVVWAALIGLYNVVTNRTVKWGKAEEEERLTGRQETRRSLREWCAVFTATFFMSIYVLIVVLLTAVLVLRSRDAALAPPGERYLVDNEQYAIHFACVGNQTYDAKGKPNPTVLLEGGYMPVEDSFEGWVHDAYKNKTIDRYCYWDRPGIAWSENAPSPHSAGMSADAISEALAIAGEDGPWILVSAGIGSIYSRVFSARHPRAISGMMLIDGLHEDLLYRTADPGRGFVLWGRGIISPLGLDRLAGALFKGRTAKDRVYGRSSYQGGKFIKNKLQENLVANSLTKNEVVTARNIQMPKVPLVVVTSGVHVRKDKDWERKQEDLTKITDTLLAWDIVKGAPPEEIWRTETGRQVLEKRLGQLYKAS
jgi:pimeloyl-ACP methyl ester carboxylesterase